MLHTLLITLSLLTLAVLAVEDGGRSSASVTEDVPSSLRTKPVISAVRLKTLESIAAEVTTVFDKNNRDLDGFDPEQRIDMIKGRVESFKEQMASASDEDKDFARSALIEGFMTIVNEKDGFVLDRGVSAQIAAIRELDDATKLSGDLDTSCSRIAPSSLPVAEEEEQEQEQEQEEDISHL